MALVADINYTTQVIYIKLKVTKFAIKTDEIKFKYRQKLDPGRVCFFVVGLGFFF